MKKKEILGKLYDYESFENRVKYLPNEFNIYNFSHSFLFKFKLIITLQLTFVKYYLFYNKSG